MFQTVSIFNEFHRFLSKSNLIKTLIFNTNDKIIRYFGEDKVVIEKEYRGMTYTSQEQEKELGYGVILKYYREKEVLIDGSEVYAMRIERKIIYKKEEFLPEICEESAIISTNKDIANQIIEIFKINQVCPGTLQEIYNDMNINKRLN